VSGGIDAAGQATLAGAPSPPVTWRFVAAYPAVQGDWRYSSTRYVADSRTSRELARSTSLSYMGTVVVLVCVTTARGVTRRLDQWFSILS
jgi:hypothetical protein